MDITFLFTDIEDSTRLWRRNAEAMHRTLALHDELLADVIEGHGGQVFKHTGDGLCSRFESTDAAATAAQEIQLRLARTSFEPFGEVRVRIGIHVGSAAQRHGDYFGLDVGHTERVMSAGHGGQILLSDAARRALTADLSLRSLGEHRLKGHPGLEHLHQLIVPELPDEFPPVRTLSAGANNLPTMMSSFIGRADELADLERLLRVNPVVTIVGPGGSGKTRLAIEVAGEQVPERAAAGVWMVELTEVSSTVEIVAAISTVPALAAERSTAGEGTSDGPGALLVLDNCEHVVEIIAPLVVDMLRRSPNLTVLATSRRPLGIAGERVFHLGSMAGASIDGTADDAVLLFESRARAASSDITFNEDTRRDVLELCRRLDGLPLGIELAAARVTALSPRRLLDLLDKRLDVLATRYAAEQRHRSLTDLIEWSYRLLGGPDQRLLRSLSVFRGGFTLDAAAAVADIDDTEAAMGVSELVDTSMVAVYRRDGDRRRYRLLETIGMFARERLEETDEAEAVTQAHTSYFRALASDISPERMTGRDGAERVAQWSEDLDNIRAALQHAIHRGDLDATLDLIGGFVRLSSFKSWGSEATGLLEQILDAFADRIPSERQPSLQAMLGIALFHAGDLPRCIEVLETATEQFEAMQPEGSSRRGLGDYPSALNALAEAYDLSGLGGDSKRRHLELIERSLEVARKLGNRYAAAVAMFKLAEHGDHASVEEARGRFDDAETAARELDSPARLGTVQTQRASFEAAHGNLDLARRHWQRSADAFADSGDDASRLTSTMLVGTCDVLLGDPSGLDRFIEHAGQLFTVLEDDAPVHHPLIAIRAVIDAALGRFDRVATASGMSQTLESTGRGLRADLVGHFRNAQIAATRTLGEERFHDAQRRGRGATPGEMRDFVLEPPSP